MGRDAIKSMGNRYFEARMAACGDDGCLRSRERASEQLGIGADSLANYENGLCKVVPAENVLRMARVYGAPELLNQYCTLDCPIGHQMVQKLEARPLEAVALKMVYSLEDLELIKRMVVKITVDGVIDDGERSELDGILACFGELEQSIGEFRLWCMKHLDGIWTRVG